MHVSEDDQLYAGATYFALEILTLLPTDMLRTVRLDEIQPATLCHPDCDRSFTKVSPFMNAAMSKAERVHPWHDFSDEGELNVHGISVFCKDTASIIREEVNPFVDVLTQKDVTYSIPLAKYNKLV